MSRRHVDVALQPLAVRRAEAAAICGLSEDHFDRYARPFLPVVRLGSVTVWRVADLDDWLRSQASAAPVDDLARRRAA